MGVLIDRANWPHFRSILLHLGDYSVALTFGENETALVFHPLATSFPLLAMNGPLIYSICALVVLERIVGRLICVSEKNHSVSIRASTLNENS